MGKSHLKQIAHPTAQNQVHTHRQDTSTCLSLLLSRLCFPVLLVGFVPVLSGVRLIERFSRPIGIVRSKRIRLGVIDPDHTIRVYFCRKLFGLRTLQEIASHLRVFGTVSSAKIRAVPRKVVCECFGVTPTSVTCDARECTIEKLAEGLPADERHDQRSSGDDSRTDGLFLRGNRIVACYRNHAILDLACYR